MKWKWQHHQRFLKVKEWFIWNGNCVAEYVLWHSGIGCYFNFFFLSLIYCIVVVSPPQLTRLTFTHTPKPQFDFWLCNIRKMVFTRFHTQKIIKLKGKFHFLTLKATHRHALSINVFMLVKITNEIIKQKKKKKEKSFCLTLGYSKWCDG